MATLAEIRLYVQRLFGDENQAVVVNAELDEYINEGVWEVAKLTESYGTVSTTITTTDAYGRVSLPADYIKTKEIRLNGLTLPLISPSLLKFRYSTPEQGEPFCWYPWDYDQIQLWPVKISATGLDIILMYTAYPAIITAADTPTIPSSLHKPGAGMYALAKCYQKVSDQQMAGYALGSFQGKIQDYIYNRDNPMEGVSTTVGDTEGEYTNWL